MQWLWITKMQWEICSVLSGWDSHLAVLLIVCITGMQIISEAIIYSSEHSQKACKQSQTTQDTQSDKVLLVQFSVS